MIEQLVRVSERFRKEKKLPPTGYKVKSPKWIVNIEGSRVYLEGPYAKGEIKSVPVPDRQRAGKPTPNNLKPFLLVDDARYALGKPEEEKDVKKREAKEKEAKLLHQGFVSLLQEAYEATGIEEFLVILNFLSSDQKQEVYKSVEPKDIIAFRVNGKDLTTIEEVQRFWAHYLSREVVTEHEAQCGICGSRRGVVRILPREVVVLGQKCQISSFNKTAFLSFGKEQTANAPMCFPCASQAVDALDYLIRSEQHRRVLWSDPGKGSGLENQLAVFWLEKETVVNIGEQVFDLEALLGSVIDDRPVNSAPAPELSQLNALLAVPWTGNDQVLNLDETKFCLAILSANKARLVIREWLETEVGNLRKNLREYLEATRMVSPRGEEARPLSIANIIKAVHAQNPNLIRGLVRTAYLGVRPPHGLMISAVRAFRNPNVLQDPEESGRLQALASVLKFCLFFGKEEGKKMSELHSGYRSRAYLCGRLLAILEEAQLRASGFSLNRTLVDRFYGAASTAPAATFGGLLRLATTAHLPNVGNEVKLLVEEVMSVLDECGGFPKTLTLAEQAEFGLGFYHQRAAFRANRGKTKDQNKGGEE